MTPHYFFYVSLYVCLYYRMKRQSPMWILFLFPSKVYIDIAEENNTELHFQSSDLKCCLQLDQNSSFLLTFFNDYCYR